MRMFGVVPCDFWTNSDTQSFSEPGKLLALYLLTSKHTTLIGCFRLPTGYIQDDLDWSSEMVLTAFGELFLNGFATVDERSGWVLVHRYLEWNPIKNPNMGQHAVRLFQLVPSTVSLRSMLANLLINNGRFLPPEFLNSLEAIREPSLNKDKGKEQEKPTTSIAVLLESAAADGGGISDAQVGRRSSTPSTTWNVPRRASKRAQNLQIAELAMAEPMAEAWNRVKDAWPRFGYNSQTRLEAPRFTNPARAGAWFKMICDETPIKLAAGQRLSPGNLADATLAWLARKKAEAPGGRYPVVPCIENFFSCESTSKLHWQTALLEFFGVSEVS